MTGKRQQDADDTRNQWLHDRERLIAIAHRILQDRHEAEDIVQETVTAVWQRQSQIRDDKIDHYLCRAVRRNALKRRLRRRTFVPLFPSAGHDGEPTSIVDPVDLEDAIQALPKAQQTVIRMKYFFGMTFGQIGSTLSISANTAASRCRYAISKLRDVFLREKKT